ncbi:MAG TPA: amino acid adenylation domain-containing protein [Longimicrobiaceae bacterium]|nr:amino acid adenylation domain-containing protein [Longimicrobiaceae bacterium]
MSVRETVERVVVPGIARAAEWNRTEMEYPRHLCVHRLFEEQAARTPGRLAVEGSDGALTYAELDRRAAALAARLAGCGVGPEDRVGIFVERSAEMLVALLAVLKSGGAYLPLDPVYPAERIAYILEDAGAKAILTQRALVETLPAHGAEVLFLDAEAASPGSGGGDGERVAVSPENLAYVIYTSGSTGRPKGVELPHRAVVNFLHTMRESPGLGADDTLLAVTTLSFDIAGLEIFLPLVNGARVVVAGREAAADARLLAERLASSGATVMQATPATWRMLLASGWAGRPGLRAFCGGEALDGELARRLRPLVAELWNLYGPTETTIWSTVQRVEDTSTAPPIGRPIGNTRVYLLDEALDPAPVGVEGELYIAGDGVARGYHGRPELTAERFVPEPGVPGARMYRTGDRVRLAATGALQYLGRADFQVKVRGFRIELGEIEAALARHPTVRQAVVAAREDAPGEQRLVAYLVAEDGGLPQVGELRATLQEELPEYMVPAVFVELEAMPLTPNGKVDRRALPSPAAAARVRTGSEYVAPRTALEEVLAGFWAELLGVERVGVRDNVIDLGAHSVMATQLIARLEPLKVRLPLRAVFDAPTVEALARLIVAGEEVPGRTEKVAEIFRKVKRMSADQRRDALQARHSPGVAQ